MRPRRFHMLHVHVSNRLERLADELARLAADGRADAFREECIVVESRGMERWISLHLARRIGVWARARFPFPSAFASDLFRRADGEPADAPFDRDALPWSILDLLPGRLDRPAYAPLGRYLADDPSGLKAWQLARRIADAFDKYGVFRPDLLAEWEAGRGGDDWQPDLWRALVDRHGRRHRAALRERLLREPGALDRALRDGPDRVFVFGLSTIAPFHLELLRGLASRLDVHVFAMNPCREYWGDIRSRREAASLARRSGRPARDAPALHLAEGNPLLASMGRLSRDFHDALAEIAGEGGAAEDLFEEPGDGTALRRVQSDILHLRAAGEDGVPPVETRDDDTSISVHSCHGRWREVEVLHDRLLDRFERTPGLEPRDVVVMAPDIGAYAPAIQAVFDSASPRIPYAVADRPARWGNPAGDALAQWFALVGGRFGAGEVLDLLANPCVRRRWGLSEDEVDDARRRVAACRVTWGIDARHRAQWGVPPDGTRTWREALDRMLLGQALPADGRRLYEGRLPYDDVEGASADALGRLAAFVEALAASIGEAARPRPPAEWAAWLSAWFERLVETDDDTERGAAAARDALRSLGAKGASCARPVPMAAVRAHVAAALDGGVVSSPYLAGGVTFCHLMPMRGVPFRVVALLGMNDADYPRRERETGFDLVARHPRPGDRTRRADDRYLFLEALLSARDAFHVSYVGQSARDNAALPPSVLVSELLDYLAAGRDDAASARARLVVRHPLQPFSPRYFAGDPRLFSFAADYAQAGEAVRDGPVPSARPAPLPERPPDGRPLELAAFVRFFRDPARAFLRDRLGARLPDASDAFDDREPLEEDALDRHEVRARLFDYLEAGGAPGEAPRFLAAAGLLPAGAAGRLAADGAAAAVADFRRSLDALRGAPPRAIDVDIDAGGLRLTGRLNDVFPRHRLWWRMGRLRGADLLAAWIEHLALCAAAAPGAPARTIALGLDDARAWGAAPDARERLAALAGLYRRGQREPLPLFPEASAAYAEKLLASDDPDQARHAASEAWISGRDAHPGEWERSPDLQVLYRDGDALDDAFASCAREVFEPLLARAEPGAGTADAQEDA